MRNKNGAWLCSLSLIGVVLANGLVGETTGASPQPSRERADRDESPWGKDPFFSPPEPSAESEARVPSGLELQGVIAGPTGVRAILNREIVQVGDRVDGELVLDITPNAIVLQRGAEVRRLVIRSFALPR